MTKDQVIIELHRRITELEKSVNDSELVKRSLVEANGRFKAILQSSPLAIQTLTPDGTVTMWNDAAERIFGWNQDEIIGKFNPMVPEDKQEEFRQLRERVLSGESFSGVDVRRQKKDGLGIDVSLSTAPLHDTNGNINGIVAIISDITERKQIEKKLRDMAVTDELTGLYNRRGFFTLVEQMVKIAKREKQRVCMLYGDLDNLKEINDRWGHQEGDLALVNTANILKVTYRESDIIARIGGDEFVIVPVGTSLDNVEIVTARLQESLKNYNTKKTHDYKLSLSVGIAYYDPENPCSIDEMLAVADKAMYEQKKIKRSNDRKGKPQAVRCVSRTRQKNA